MGLDAAVYSDDECEAQIASVRLGNLDDITGIRMLLEERCPEAVTLLTKVVYSATHSGDFLKLEEVSRVRAELKGVELRCGAELSAREFVSAFAPLVDLAEEHSRPIMFV
ncbi:MAG: hypothetical protein SynsKO_44620 [Synoicihabitans sp.]